PPLFLPTSHFFFTFGLSILIATSKKSFLLGFFVLPVGALGDPRRYGAASPIGDRVILNPAHAGRG
ncbi:hypothetical protein LINPERHAP1_LOCUS36819, partial [Linum perenne]